MADPQGASLPSTLTIARLADVAGSQPVLVPVTSRAELFTVPVLSTTLLAELQKGADVRLIVERGKDGERIAMSYRPSPLAFAVRIDRDTLAARGVQMGDVIVVEPVEILPPVNGSMVVALVDGECGAYIYQPPFLLPQSLEPAQPVRLDNAFILGRAVHLERPLT